MWRLIPRKPFVKVVECMKWTMKPETWLHSEKWFACVAGQHYQIIKLLINLNMRKWWLFKMDVSVFRMRICLSLDKNLMDSCSWNFVSIVWRAIFRMSNICLHINCRCHLECLHCFHAKEWMHSWPASKTTTITASITYFTTKNENCLKSRAWNCNNFNFKWFYSFFGVK